MRLTQSQIQRNTVMSLSMWRITIPAGETLQKLHTAVEKKLWWKKCSNVRLLNIIFHVTRPHAHIVRETFSAEFVMFSLIFWQPYKSCSGIKRLIIITYSLSDIPVYLDRNVLHTLVTRHVRSREAFNRLYEYVRLPPLPKNMPYLAGIDLWLLTCPCSWRELAWIFYRCHLPAAVIEVKEFFIEGYYHCCWQLPSV